MGRDLVPVVLFGSVARHEAGPASDVDLLVILESAPRGRFARQSLVAPALERLDADIERLADGGIYTDIVPVVRRRAEAIHTRPYYLDMVEEGGVGLGHFSAEAVLARTPALVRSCALVCWGRVGGVAVVRL